MMLYGISAPRTLTVSCRYVWYIESKTMTEVQLNDTLICAKSCDHARSVLVRFRTSAGRTGLVKFKGCVHSPQGQRYKSLSPRLACLVLPPTSLVVAMKFCLGSRQPVATSSVIVPSNPIKEDFPEALTYRFNDNSAWVPAAKNHDVNFFIFFYFYFVS
jgi:hypothetical protein